MREREEDQCENFQLGDINTWGLDVFSASRAIKDGRVLTSTTFKIFQERNTLNTSTVTCNAAEKVTVLVKAIHYKNLCVQSELQCVCTAQLRLFWGKY